MHNVALEESSGFAVIDNYDASNTGATQFTKSINEGFTVCSLDQFNFKNIHFMKIDVEGFEKGVLKGDKETIKSSKPIIWIEISPDNFEIVQNILKEYGYDTKEQLAESDYISEPRR